MACPYTVCMHDTFAPKTPSARRTFLKQVATLAGAFSANSLFSQAHAADFKAASGKIANLSPDLVAQNEDYWSVIQRSYSVNSNLINLNNGGVSPAPVVVQQAVERYNSLSNEGPSYYMWRILDQGREPLREKLAALAGTSPEEIAIDRNATEALLTVIHGLDLKPGDEVLGTKQDYPTSSRPISKRRSGKALSTSRSVLTCPWKMTTRSSKPTKPPSPIAPGSSTSPT